MCWGNSVKILKGFVTIQSLLSNVPGTISPIGELSNMGYSYAKDIGEYTNANVEGYRLLAMHSFETGVGKISIPQDMVLYALSAARACVVFGNANIEPYDRAALHASIQADTRLFGKIKDIRLGEIVYGDDLGVPTWLSFVTVVGGHYVKIWLSDTAFVNQYDEFEITVIPPLPVLDDLIAPFASVNNKLQAQTMPEVMERIQVAKQDKPESFIRSLNFDYSLPTDRATKLVTTWTVLVYGIAGDNIDAIKDALVDYITKNTTKPRENWEAVLPEIFRRTEFVILPRWDVASVPNLTVLSGLYGSMITPQNALAFSKNRISFYTDTHVHNNVVIFPYDFKGITLHAVAGPQNRDGCKKLTDLFPDYIPVPSTSLDFSRMQTKTQEWVYLLGEMLLMAETANEYSATGGRLRKIYRDNMLFISATYDNVAYLVSARFNYDLDV